MDLFYNLQGCKDTFPCAAVLVENKYLYFVTMYNNILYKLDLDKGKWEEIFIPVGNKKPWSFRTLLYIDEKVFLLPNSENFFLQFDPITKTFERIFSELHRACNAYPVIRECVKIGKLFYLLDAASGQLLIVDMEEKRLIQNILLVQYNREVEKHVYISLKQYDDFLIIFGKPGRFLLKIDALNYKVDKIETQHEIPFGEVVGEDVFYLSGSEEIDGIYKYNIRNQTTQKVAGVEYTKRADIKLYRFWNTKRIGNKLYFLPHEASIIIVYDLDNFTVSSIDPFDGIDYFSMRRNKERAVYDLIPYQNSLIVVPFDGNIISIVDIDRNDITAYRFPIKEELVMKCFFEAEDMVFEKQFTLRDLLMGLKDIKKDM